MAKVYRAATRIEHGQEDDGKNKKVVFEENEVVKDLDKDTMAELWDAGALYESTDDEDAAEAGAENKQSTPPSDTTDPSQKPNPTKATGSRTSTK